MAICIDLVIAARQAAAGGRRPFGLRPPHRRTAGPQAPRALMRGAGASIWKSRWLAYLPAAGFIGISIR